jgi:phage tail sheath gpL-like
MVGDVAVQILVGSTDPAATVATNLKAQFDLPVTAAVAGAVVTLTARNMKTLARLRAGLFFWSAYG